MSTTADPKTHTDRELTLTRVLDAPRALVWKAWTDSKQMAQWWGPKGFTNPVCELDLRPGGAIRIDMRAPNGTVYPMTGIFREIVPPQRLVFVAYAQDHSGNKQIKSLTTATFEEHQGKTRLTVHARARGLMPIGWQMIEGMEAGWNGSLDRLAELVGRAQ